MSNSARVFRFAFGTYEAPRSAIWRIVAKERTGDVYVSQAKSLGHAIHVSLHASGRNSYKRGDARDKLLPPLKIGEREIAFRIHFRDVAKNLASPDPDTKKFTSWLGMPRAGRYFAIEFFYSKLPASSVSLNNGETILFADIPAALSHERRYLQVSLREIPLTIEDFRNIAVEGIGDLVIGFRGATPEDFAEEIKVEVLTFFRTLNGISTFVYSPFHASARNDDLHSTLAQHT